MKKSQYSDFDAKYWYDEGKRLTEKSCHREAVEAFDLAIQINSWYAEAYLARGACHYVLGNYRQAGDDLDAAALLGCQDAQFWSKYPVYPSEKDSKDKA